ncbi:sugar transferase [Skermanella mucosa]|uniref:sugar transferase n=1 Tax=Skermanella mucosa TaxID=1789672 RepID=UPI00192B00C9|nr:sugar transferase [Skermanella mucosa]UEM19624.1 sugar transferase [Skermanella mucosa]
MSVTEAGRHDTALPIPTSAGPLSGYGVAKRLFDIVVAGILLGLLAPLLALVGLAVRLETRGPALFRQRRCGAGAGTFNALKFRTMHADAEARLDRLLAADPVLRAEYQRHHKLRDDPRVTRVGRILRRTSLDELPQLWNVLSGDMSLVGPRPYMPHELAGHPGAHAAIARVKPGMTGLWQVSGRHRTTFEDRLRLDLAYVEGRSFRQDLAILRRTVMVIVRADGI